MNFNVDMLEAGLLSQGSTAVNTPMGKYVSFIEICIRLTLTFLFSSLEALKNTRLH